MHPVVRIHAWIHRCPRWFRWLCYMVWVPVLLVGLLLTFFWTMLVLLHANWAIRHSEQGDCDDSDSA